MNGTIVTEFLAALNTPPCFADHCDWRIPNFKELYSITNLENQYGFPAVSPAFNTACTSTCTVLTCSCTFPNAYWSSSTNEFDPLAVWVVDFANSLSAAAVKTGYCRVRAVRSGS